jgi:hypothetical protein
MGQFPDRERHLLLATDGQAVTGVLYGANATKRAHANAVYSFINDTGGV